MSRESINGAKKIYCEHKNIKADCIICRLEGQKPNLEASANCNCSARCDAEWPRNTLGHATCMIPHKLLGHEN